ncbi:MAG: sodium/solute symporter [Calditerrivibrio sp.]|nr:sodium/solute symporter [Calditerrivibrio sp.]MCA1932368.1 sodium/solute symporter [Calditerrivibrio sp.]
MDNAANVVQQFSFGKPNASSITFFFIVVFITLFATYMAAKRSQKTASSYYTGGGGISGFQNGLALAGDYMSAASFLGISGMVALKGYDGVIYAVGWLVGWPALLFLIAEPLRNLGKFSFADVVAFRLNQKPIKTAAAIGGLLVLLSYTTAQMVGSGSLIKLLFGFSYELSVVIVGIAMLIYLLLGGMLATTWVQIIKASLLLAGVTLITILVLAKFNFNPGELYGAVSQKYGQTALEPGGFIKSGADAFSLGLALMLGLLGLPHILMRFFTVPNAKEARKSIVWATTWIGYFYIIIPIVGYGATVLVTRETITSIDKGGNMAAVMLAEVMGGSALMGFISAVAFATILAVVAGLTIAASAALANDLWIGVVKGGKATETEKYKSAKTATFIYGIIAIFLGISFKGQNVAFLVGLAFAVAASANFPALFLSIVWKKFSTTGAVLSILVGGLSAMILIIIGPTVWVDVLKHAAPIFPYKFPTIFSLPLAFIAGWIGSIIAPDLKAQELFEDEKLRTYLGVGVADAHDH